MIHPMVLQVLFYFLLGGEGGFSNKLLPSVICLRSQCRNITSRWKCVGEVESIKDFWHVNLLQGLEISNWLRVRYGACESVFFFFFFPAEVCFNMQNDIGGGRIWHSKSKDGWIIIKVLPLWWLVWTVSVWEKGYRVQGNTHGGFQQSRIDAEWNSPGYPSLKEGRFLF